MFVVGRGGVGGLRLIVTARRQRVDEGLQATPLSVDPRADLIESWVGAVHDAIVTHLSSPTAVAEVQATDNRPWEE